MQKLMILNSKESKDIQSKLEAQFGASVSPDYSFLMNKENRIFIINNDISAIDLEKLRINSLGLYIGEKMADGIRLSIEGSQIIGKKATKSIVELDKKETTDWLKGIDIDKEMHETGFVILKHNRDFLGCGKVKENRILNFVPKVRRLNLSGDMP